MALRENGQWERKNTQTIEERIFQVALILIEMHFSQQTPTAVKYPTKTREAIRRTMEKTLNSSQIRYVFTLGYHYLCYWIGVVVTDADL